MANLCVILKMAKWLAGGLSVFLLYLGVVGLIVGVIMWITTIPVACAIMDLFITAIFGASVLGVICMLAWLFVMEASDKAKEFRRECGE